MAVSAHTGMAPDEQGVHRIDGGALRCARLLVLLRNHTARLPDAAVIHLGTADPAAPIDLPAWCWMTGHTYLGTVPGPGTATYGVQVTVTPVPTELDAPWRVAR